MGFFFSDIRCTGYDITSTLWGIVIGLLQDDDTSVQNAGCWCIRQVIDGLPTSLLSGNCPQFISYPGYGITSTLLEIVIGLLHDDMYQADLR